MKDEGKVWRTGTLVYTSSGLVVLFIWLLGADFAWSLRDRSIWPVAQWYLNHIDIPKWLFGVLLSFIPGVIILVVGPIVSVRSDRHRGRRGRRIPFLLVTAPIVALGMIGLGATPYLAKWTHDFFSSEGHAWFAHARNFPGGGSILSLLQNEKLVAVFFFGIFWVAFEIATISSQAVFGGLINDVVPKPLLGRFYGLFRAISLIDGMIFNYVILGKVPEHYTLILLCIGVSYGLILLVACLNIKEGEYPPPPEPSANSDPSTGKALQEIRSYVRECFSNSYYVSVFLLLMLGLMALVPINMFSIPYALSLGVNMDSYGKIVALTYLISLCISYFVGWFADVFHPLRAVSVALAGVFLITITGVFFIQNAETFLSIFLVFGVISGCYLTSVSSLGQRLFPKSKFAQFTSAAGVFTAFGNMLVGPLMGALIDWQANNYRVTFMAASLVSLLALTVSIYVLYRFMKLGGPANYVAPGSDPTQT